MLSRPKARAKVVVSPPANTVARTTMVRVGPRAKGKDSKSSGKGKGDSNREKPKESSKEKCQICEKTGHNASKCFQRYKGKGSVQQASEKNDKLGYLLVRQMPRRDPSSRNQTTLLQLLSEMIPPQRRSWQGTRWASHLPTSMAKPGVYWIRVRMSTFVLKPSPIG